MADASLQQITQLLRRAGDGDPDAYAELLPSVFSELRLRAARSLARERSGHTLQATALVHDAWLKLVDQRSVTWKDRSHFYAMAATCIRRLLLDHARRRQAKKRRGLRCAFPAGEIASEPTTNPDELLDLDQALRRLEEYDARKARAVEMRYFGGMENREIAVALDVSVGTVGRDLRLARAWLQSELTKDERGESDT
ncbi:MAG: sigma-70 family RNA polymerase sigma factor [Planctomycetes bacterium]|nr:sigma-70 family RNA polymerase sigma factor [Planctomycetota bacterium]